MSNKTVVCIVGHDDHYFLEATIRSFHCGLPIYLFLSRIPWHGEPGNWKEMERIANSLGVTVIFGDWGSEEEHRNAAYDWLKANGFAYVLVPDGDEVIEPRLLDTLLRIAEQGIADRVYIEWNTYWRSEEYVIRPREPFTPIILASLSNAKYENVRNWSGGKALLLNDSYGIVHHLSYAGTDERILRKITSWGHRNEVRPDWYENVWLRWPSDKSMRCLHPTSPQSYGFVERIHVPAALSGLRALCYREIETQEDHLAKSPKNRGKKRTGGCVTNVLTAGAGNTSPGKAGSSYKDSPSTTPGQGPGPGVPTVSVVIPLYGGEDDIDRCLRSLQNCHDLILETIVVDNGSKDNAADVAEGFSGSAPPDNSEGKRSGLSSEPPLPVRASPTSSTLGRGFDAELLSGCDGKNGAAPAGAGFDLAAAPGSPENLNLRVIRLGDNKGFAAACNLGIVEAKGEVALLLNSDTVVTRAGLTELLRSLNASGSIAAAGPHTNQSGHGQQVEVTYTSQETVDLFAADFAERDAEDTDVDMLVGFCLAIKKRVLDEIGPLDEEFGFGTFEDNDACYRMRRAGYRLVLSGKSFIHHEGSKTLTRMGIDMVALMDRNRKYFLEKWKRDLELGFVNSLSGLGPPLEFHASHAPEKRMKEIAKLAKKANISLCMIVRDEERVLGECLDSIKPFVTEMIVVDTGSKDRTKEIALEKGAKVYDFPWTFSFSEARNESLKYAKGKFIFWFDADDVIDLKSGEELLRNAISAPRNIVGFVVPVRFTDDGPAGGVQVDHVKLFRNRPGIKFQFHIHEQVLHSLRKPGKGEIARSAAFVLHKGYDTSHAGQEKKRGRDNVLLELDLKENPDHPFVNFNCGMTAHYRNDHEEAIEFLTKSIELAKPDESHVRKAYSLLAVSLEKLGRKGEAFSKLEEAHAAMPDDPEVHFHMAQVLSSWGRVDRAYDHYSAVLKADPSSYFSSVDRGIFGFKTYHNRAGVLMAMGRYLEAKSDWLKAIEQAPQYSPSVYALFDAALGSLDLSTTKQMLDRVRATEGLSESWCKMVEKYGEALGGENLINELLLWGVGIDRNAWAPRLTLARRLLVRGREVEAAPLLDQLQRMGIAEGAFHLGVMAEKAGDYSRALTWMGRAAELNPGHADTVKHLAMLKECLEENP